MVPGSTDLDYSWEEEVMKFDGSSKEESENDTDDDEYLPTGERNTDQTFHQDELNNFLRNSGLPKDEDEYLAEVLKKKNLLTNGPKAYVYCNREKDFQKFFTKDEENSLEFCSDVKGLINELK